MGTVAIAISLQILVADFFKVRLSLNKGKVTKVAAVERPTKTQLEEYALRLRHELDSFARTGNIRHLVSIVYSGDLVVCMVELCDTRETQGVNISNATNGWQSRMTKLKESINQRFSQWVYVQREVRFFGPGAKVAYICKSPRLIDWTQTQAIFDANDIINEGLAHAKIEFDPFAPPSNYEH